jgi:hypothetical protein
MHRMRSDGMGWDGMGSGGIRWDSSGWMREPRETACVCACIRGEQTRAHAHTQRRDGADQGDCNLAALSLFSAHAAAAAMLTRRRRPCWRGGRAGAYHPILREPAALRRPGRPRPAARRRVEGVGAAADVDERRLGQQQRADGGQVGGERGGDEQRLRALREQGRQLRTRAGRASERGRESASESARERGRWRASEGQQGREGSCELSLR